MASEHHRSHVAVPSRRGRTLVPLFTLDNVRATSAPVETVYFHFLPYALVLKCPTSSIRSHLLPFPRTMVVFALPSQKSQYPFFSRGSSMSNSFLATITTGNCDFSQLRWNPRVVWLVWARKI